MKTPRISGFSRTFSDTALIEAKIIEEKARNTRQLKAVFRPIRSLFAVACMRPKKNAQKMPIPGEVPMLCPSRGYTVRQALVT